MTDPLSISASISGLVTLADIVFGRTYKYVKAVTKAQKDIAALSTEIGALYGILSNLQLVSRQLEHERTDSTTRIHHINSCYQTLERIRSILDRDDTSSLSNERLQSLKRNLKWPFKSSEVKDLIAEIERHKTTLGLALNVDCMSGLLHALSKHDEIQDTVNGIKTELKERYEAETRIAINKETQEIMKSFAKVDYRSNHEMSRKLRSPGTGLWLTEGQEFRQWMETKNARLWLYGIPGAGKTVLASSVIEEALQTVSPSTAVAYFYCDYKDASKQDLANILGSLAQQLAKDEESFAKLRHFYEKYNPEHRLDFKYDSKALLDLVRALTLGFDCAIIIVDGLDECGTSTSHVIDALTTLNEGADTTVKMIILSRDEIEIRERLEGYTKVSIAARSSDLRLYVGSEIEIRMRKKRLRIKDHSLKEHILERLVEGAEGMFRWVTCQMDYLCELPNDAARRKALDSLPPDLNATYERILDRVNRSNPETQKLVQRALRWIANPMRNYHLSSQALCEAVSVDPGSTKLNSEAIPDEYEILHWCSSLVRRSAEGWGLELAHFTVKEFLQQIECSRDVSISAYRIHYKIDEISLAKVCLTYLNFQDFDQSVLQDRRDTERRLREYPFRGYAINMLWMIRYDDVDDHELVSLAQKLWSPSKSNNFISWMYDISARYFIHGHWDEDRFSVIRSGLAETTALHWMALCGFCTMCSWLIESGCGVNRSSPFGTPLHCALLGWKAYSWHLHDPNFEACQDLLEDDAYDDLAILLLGAGADPNCLWGPKKLSTLLIALKRGNSKIVMRLLDEGGILDNQCLNMLESHLDNQDICDIINHASKHNVEPDGWGRLLQLAIRAETPNATRLIQKDNGSPLNSMECGKMLRTAAEFGQLDIVRGLLEDQRLDVDAVDESTGMTALHHAARADQLEITKVLMAHGANSSTYDSQGRTALHYSLEGRDVRCLGFLLHQGADTSLVDIPGMSVLHLAAQDGNVQALSILLDGSVDPASVRDLKTKDGRTPLLCASASNSKAAVSLLLGVGCSLTETASDGSSSLHYAARSGSIEVVKFLLELGVDPCKTRDEERTPLQDLVDAIKENSSSPDKLDCLFAASQMLLKSSLERSRTALDLELGSELVYLASLHIFPSAEKTISTLLKLGLSPNVNFDDGNTALMAAAKNGNGVVLSNLIRHGADLCSNDSGIKALIYACSNGHTDIVFCLRGTGFDWNSKTTASLLGTKYTGVTAVHLAAVEEDSSILTFLLKEGLVSDINVRTGSGETPLLLAGWAGASRNVSILLSHNADSTCINERGDSAVHIAAIFGHADVVSELMRHGSNLTLQNSCGLTPELLARKYGHESLANTILDYVKNKKYGPNDSPQTIYGGSEALKIAIDLGDLELCTRLVENGTDVDTRLECCMGCSPLLYSLAHEQHAIAEYLVSHGASIAGSTCELISTRGFTVFHYAAIWNAKLLRLVLEKAPNEIQVMEDPIHPIHLAVHSGNAACLQLILDHVSQGRGRTLSDPLSTQESVNRMVNLQLQGDKLRRPRYGPREESLLGIFETAKPLHIAADTGHLPIARMLLAYGASVDGEETNLATPLHYAAKNGQTAMVKVLLEAEANPNALDSMLRSPCMSAIESDSVDIIRLLLKYGADLQLRSWYGETALQLAADYAAKDVFVLLMTRSDLCAEDVDGYSLLSSTIRNAAAFPMNFVTNFCPPSEVYKTRRYSILNAAVANRSMTDVKLLLRRIPTNVLPRLLNHRDVNATPLDVAARLSKLETMNLLLDAGAQLEIEGSDHGTPLMAACATGRLAAVRLLVGRGARTSYVERGRTFGALAAARHHPEIRRWLLVGRFLEGRKLLGC